jgi:biopolymer transport protein ExbB
MLETILKGGPVTIPIILCSFVSLAVVYDRWCAFSANRKIDTRALRSKVRAHLRDGDIDAAISECTATRGPVASVLLAGLRAYQQLMKKNAGTEAIRAVVAEVMGEQSVQALSVVNKRLDVLTTIGTAAPLFGMAGTVSGMIGSFAGMAKAGAAAGGADMVAAGIAEALITTASGLIIALFAVIPQSVYNRWSDEIELEIQETSSELVEFILTHH